MCCRQCLSKVIVCLATALCCLIVMTLIMGTLGCFMMGLYSLGSFLFTGSVDASMALYVASDTAFILGGSLAFIVFLLVCPAIYQYLDQCTQHSLGITKLNRIPIDGYSHSAISLNKSELLQIANLIPNSLKEEFECPICFESMLIQQPKSTLLPSPPITLRFISDNRQSLDEQSYHQSCFITWIKSGGQREPVLGVDLFQPAGGRLVRYHGYNKRQRNAFRLFQSNKETIRLSNDDYQGPSNSFINL